MDLFFKFESVWIKPLSFKNKQSCSNSFKILSINNFHLLYELQTELVALVLTVYIFVSLM
jgi:hypothetical protein